jgi:phosphate-selective porin OprO/OprP
MTTSRSRWTRTASSPGYMQCCGVRSSSVLPLSAAALLLGGVLPYALAAQDSPSSYDDLWRRAELYVDEDNPRIQSVLLSGRFQYEYSTVHDRDLTYDEWNVRRTRLGLKARLFDQFTLHVEAGFNPEESDPFYTGLTDAYVQWSRSGPLALKAGKQSVAFTMDGSTSSKELLTIDRSNLANNMWFPQEYLPGVSASGAASNWSYHLGTYSAGERTREFGEFNGGVVAVATLGYDLSAALGVEEALLRGNYMHQNPDPQNGFTRQLQHVTSLNFAFEDGRFGVRADVSAASGHRGQSDLWGTTFMPFLDLTDELQVVARHTYLSSEEANGVRLPRYENKLTSGLGDRYNEFYAGINYYLYGHKLKLQGGVKFAGMDDRAGDGGSYSGVSGTTAFRVSW